MERFHVCYFAPPPALQFLDSPGAREMDLHQREGRGLALE